MPTIREVAQACGVSPMTVSFVLNNKRGQVSDETRERVLRAVRELGYRPTARERDARSRHVLTLGVVAGVTGDSLVKPGYYNAVVNALLIAADRGGHNVTLFTHSLLHTDVHQGLRVYCDGRCDGILVVAPNRGSELVKALHERGIPFVLIGDTGDNPTDSCVDVQNEANGRQATEYLLTRGHRRVAFIGGPDFVRSSSQRRQGYRQALASAGLEGEETERAGTGQDDSEEWRLLLEMLGRPVGVRPTALFCWNDSAAQNALRAAAVLALRVPDDVSVIGFDDDWLSAATDPPLTTMRQPFAEVGARAVEVLAGQIRGEAAGPVRLLLPAEMVVRESVGPVPAASPDRRPGMTSSVSELAG